MQVARVKDEGLTWSWTLSCQMCLGIRHKLPPQIERSWRAHTDWRCIAGLVRLYPGLQYRSILKSYCFGKKDCATLQARSCKGLARHTRTAHTEIGHMKTRIASKVEPDSM